MRRKPKQRRRARAAVLAAAGIFVLSQVALAVAAERWTPEFRDPTFAVRRRLLLERVRETPDRPLILMFGSSRVETGIRPDVINVSGSGPFTFNFGLTGAAPIQEWLAFRRLLDDGVRPRAVLIEIMPALFSDWRPVGESVMPARLSFRDLADLAPYARNSSALWGAWLAARAVPVYGSRFVLLSLVVPNWLPHLSRTDYLWNDIDRWGAGRLPPIVATPDARRAGSIRARDEYAHRLKTFAVPPGPAGLLYRFIDDCRKRGIAVAIVLMPEGPTFQKLYPPDSLQRLNRFIAQLQESMDVPLIDARNWVAESDTYDGHHLLPSGAAVFSSRLAGEIPAMKILTAGP